MMLVKQCISDLAGGD